MTKGLKYLLTLLITFLVLGVYAGDGDEKNKINWVTIEEAQELTKENPRKIFVDVYTDWCGWCKKMDKSTFVDPDVVEYVNENYYAVKLNAESREEIIFKGKKTNGTTLARSFRVSGYPTIVLIDENCEQPVAAPGFRKAHEFKKMLVDFKAHK